MGQGRLAAIARELIAHGRPADTPVALISAGTTEAQTVVECRLAEAGDIAPRLPGPLMIVIGEVVRLGRWGAQGAPQATHAAGRE